jgi:pyridoxal phosphate enzyme (YggS family)
MVWLPHMTVSTNLADVRERIRAAAQANGRSPADVTLVAVSKTHAAEQVREAIDAGQRHFGENRVQEAETKLGALRAACPDLVLHLIGPLQTNKVRQAVALFDVIETVDRPKLAHALAEEVRRSGRRPRCLIEVNIGGEVQKAGIGLRELPDFLTLCRQLDLPVGGLMCIPPQGEQPAPFFALLGKLADRYQLPVRSMGMSGDFEAAVALGATSVRVGTAIFGERPAPAL